MLWAESNVVLVLTKESVAPGVGHQQALKAAIKGWAVKNLHLISNFHAPISSNLKLKLRCGGNFHSNNCVLC